MSDRPTPETDAAQHEGLLRTNPIPMQVVTAYFAPKLEQERDEAREKYDLEAVENMLAINKICHERDEAREALRAFKHDKKHLCDSHRDMSGNCIVCQMEETK